MSTDCPCTNISNSFTITKDGVLQSVLECEDCGKREVERLNGKHKKQAMIKLCVWTDKDIGPMNMDELMEIVNKEIEEKRFYLESTNLPKGENNE